MKSVYFSKQIVPEDKYFDITLELNCYIEVHNHVIGLGELTGQVQSKNERKKLLYIYVVMYVMNQMFKTQKCLY